MQRCRTGGEEGGMAGGLGERKRSRVRAMVVF